MNDVHDALLEIRRIRQAREVCGKAPLRAGTSPRSSSSVDEIKQRLVFSESLSRRLYARAQELEMALQVGGGKVEVEQLRALAADKRSDDEVETLRQAAAKDKLIIGHLASRIKLLESGILTSKLQAASNEIDRLSQAHDRLSQNYRHLASARSETEVSRLLNERLSVLEHQHAEEAAAFSQRIFEAERLACEAFAAKAMSDHSSSAHREEWSPYRLPD